MIVEPAPEYDTSLWWSFEPVSRARILLAEAVKLGPTMSTLVKKLHLSCRCERFFVRCCPTADRIFLRGSGPCGRESLRCVPVVRHRRNWSAVTEMIA
jgi:hypothetical protein